MSDTQFYSLRVKEVRPETNDAVTVFFTVPEDLASHFEYKQGQYLTLRFHLNGQEVRRAYSMCSSPLEPDLAVTVKRLEGGLVSNHINDNLKAGSEVEVMPPQGRFYTELNPEQRKDYFLFGAGSGITPLMSILKTVLEAEPSSNVYLLYGNRDEENIIFRDELERLSQRYEGQLVVEHTLSRPRREKSGGLSGLFSRGKVTWEGLQGRIGADAVHRFLRDYEAPAKPAEFFVCGPGLMIDTVEAALKGHGIDEKKVHTERFVSADAGAVKRAGNAPGGVVEATLNGNTIELELKEGQTILDALMEGQHNPPYSCLAGACSTCMAKLEEGSVKMDACYALDDDEVADGFILACQSHPTSERVKITFDV